MRWRKEIEDIPVLRTLLGSSNRAGFILSMPGLQIKQLKPYRVRGLQVSEIYPSAFPSSSSPSNDVDAAAHLIVRMPSLDPFARHKLRVLKSVLMHS